MRCMKCGINEIKFNFSEGKIICGFCGFLMEENLSNPDLSFEGKMRGNFSVNGQFIRNSRDSTSINKNKFNDIILSSAKRKINQMSHSLKLKGSYQDEAMKFFILAIQKGFSNGKKFQNLCASSLYAVCRRKKTHHLLVDFSDITQIQTNKIGTVFLKFTRTLNISVPVVDPSLYIGRFVTGLQIGNKTERVGMSALRLIARMKREWVSTGRRPSGLCGAAILLATKLHGIKKTQKEISDIVRIGDVVIKSRLKEICKTSISNLTIEEIDAGGGDDGSRKSLLEFSYEKIKPPSMHKKSEIKISSKKMGKQNRNNKKWVYKAKKKIFEKNFSQNFRKKEAFYYLNSFYETSVKENIWNEINIKYICSHSIVARAQKEKPFAFFRLNEFSRN